MRRTLVPALVLSLTACASPSTNPPVRDATFDMIVDDVPPDAVGPVGCTPGRVKSCPCTRTRPNGTQTCLANGTFSECVCADIPSDAPGVDAVEDAHSDAALDAPDAALDATSDALPDTMLDAAPDTMLDAALDDALDATLDATPDTSPDATFDLGADVAVDVTSDEARDSSEVDVDVPTDAVPTCASGFGDCDGNPANGCETDLRSTRASCGRCGASCLSTCADGVCLDFRGISAGERHACAVRTDGTIRCWGANEAGQLGDGTSVARTAPVVVADLAGVLEVAAGAAFTCARTSGATFCWGANNNAQLGDGSYVARSLAASVRDIINPIGVSVGLDHGCALGGDRRPRCWGNNEGGALGAASPTTRSSVPLEVTGAETYRRISAGYYLTCGLTLTGAVRCWGRNSSGQVGDGTTVDRNSPQAVLSLPEATGIAAGAYHVCAVLTTGRVACWGHNEAGALGDGTAVTMRTTQGAVAGLEDAVQVASGAYHSCALRRSGRVVCWGLNDHGQLGDGTTTNRTTPVEVAGGFAAQELALGGRHSCAIGVDGRAYCWGRNSDRQLGDGTTLDRASPMLVVW